MAQDPLANATKLEELVGFDSAKRPSITKDVFQEVLGEILEERKEVAKAAAKEQLKKALDLRSQMAQARKKFETEWEKNNKELGRLVSSLQAALNGRPEPEPTEGAQEEQAVA